jgi:hypothetical protein
MRENIRGIKSVTNLVPDKEGISVGIFFLQYR